MLGMPVQVPAAAVASNSGACRATLKILNIPPPSPSKRHARVTPFFLKIYPPPTTAPLYTIRVTYERPLIARKKNLRRTNTVVVITRFKRTQRLGAEIEILLCVNYF